MKYSCDRNVGVTSGPALPCLHDIRLGGCAESGEPSLADQETAEQVRARRDGKPIENDEINQSLDEVSGGPKSCRSSLEDKDIKDQLPRNRRPRRKKKGGWPSLRGLRWNEVKAVYALQKAAREEGTPLNHVVDIHSMNEVLRADDRKLKRWLSNITKNIVQAVRGRGKKPRQASVPAVMIYEKTINGDLHVHLWLHVAPGNDALKRFHDGVEINVHRSHARTAGYLTKARLPIGDAVVEAKICHRRQGGQAAIKGSRITLNADAKKLLEPQRKNTSALTPVAANEAVVPQCRP